MVYPNLRLTKTHGRQSETCFKPLPFRFVEDLLHPSSATDHGNEALRTIDHLSTTLDSFRQQLDEFDEEGPRPAA